MSFRSTGAATAVTTAIGWTGLAVFAFLAIWKIDTLTWWIKLAASLTGALAFLGYAIEALSQELTVRRWAISQFIFTTVGVVFVIAAIFNSDVLGMHRGLMAALAGVYLVGAACCAAEAKDLF
jgi:hypothetical protein